MTTITTAKLREIAFTLGTSSEYALQTFKHHFGTRIDDTPDTGEQSMTTITQEQFEAGLFPWIKSDPKCVEAVQAWLADQGITIAPPEPPAAMVKLAREIVLKCRHPADIGDGIWSPEYVALAALQHAVDVVKDYRDGRRKSDANCVENAILTALGAA